MTKRTICIALDRALLARLDAECRGQDRSRSYVAAEALRQWLHRQAELGEGCFRPQGVTALNLTESGLKS